VHQRVLVDAALQRRLLQRGDLRAGNGEDGLRLDGRHVRVVRHWRVHVGHVRLQHRQRLRRSSVLRHDDPHVHDGVLRDAAVQRRMLQRRDVRCGDFAVRVRSPGGDMQLVRWFLERNGVSAQRQLRLHYRDRLRRGRGLRDGWRVHDLVLVH
jgi:hypothetical protein